MESKKLKGLYIMFLAIFLFLLICTYFDNQEILKNQKQILSNQKTFKMYYEKDIRGEYANRTSVTGIYYQDEDYYCVWTKDRILSDIQVTDYHESCHALVDQDYKHFCGEAQ